MPTAATFCPPFRTRRDRKALLSHLRGYDAKTREPRRHGGAIGDRALRLLEVLMFKLSDPETGRCVASYADMVRATGWARSTVIEAAGWLAESGAAIRHRLAGNGPYGCGANGWEWPDPREVFHRLFTPQRVRRADPIESITQSFPCVRPKRDHRAKEQEMLLGEAAGDPAAVPLPDARWQGEVEAAVRRAQATQEAAEAALGAEPQLVGDTAQDGPLLGADGRALILPAKASDEALLPSGELRIAAGEVEQVDQPPRLERRVTAAFPPPLRKVRRVHDLAEIVIRCIHAVLPPPTCPAAERMHR